MASFSPRSVRLSRSGQLAELRPDTLTDSGMVLTVGGAEQSHVELDDPSFLLHDYLRRMRSVLTATCGDFPDGHPRTLLHLGAGALTLPRWVQHRWPATVQTVVDYEPELVEFVLSAAPMQPPPEVLTADAAEVFHGPLAAREFDVVVVDLYNSAQAPESLTSPGFFTAVRQAAAAGGLVLVNFGDDAGMDFARRVARTMIESLGGPQCGLLSAPDGVIAAREEGNLVYAARPGSGFSEQQLGQIWAAGPHPGEVLTGEELAAWAPPHR